MLIYCNALMQRPVVRVSVSHGLPGEAIRGKTLRCVGIVDSRFFDDGLTDTVIILAEYSTNLIGAPDNFYCAVSVTSRLAGGVSKRPSAQYSSCSYSFDYVMN